MMQWMLANVPHVIFETEPYLLNCVLPKMCFKGADKFASLKHSVKLKKSRPGKMSRIEWEETWVSISSEWVLLKKRKGKRERIMGVDQTARFTVALPPSLSATSESQSVAILPPPTTTISLPSLSLSFHWEKCVLSPYEKWDGMAVQCVEFLQIGRRPKEPWRVLESYFSHFFLVKKLFLYFMMTRLFQRYFEKNGLKRLCCCSCLAFLSHSLILLLLSSVLGLRQLFSFPFASWTKGIKSDQQRRKSFGAAGTNLCLPKKKRKEKLYFFCPFIRFTVLTWAYAESFDIFCMDTVLCSSSLDLPSLLFISLSPPLSPTLFLPLSNNWEMACHLPMMIAVDSRQMRTGRARERLKKSIKQGQCSVK